MVSSLTFGSITADVNHVYHDKRQKMYDKTRQKRYDKRQKMYDKQDRLYVLLTVMRSKSVGMKGLGCGRNRRSSEADPQLVCHDSGISLRL